MIQLSQVTSKWVRLSMGGPNSLLNEKRRRGTARTPDGFCPVGDDKRFDTAILQGNSLITITTIY